MPSVVDLCNSTLDKLGQRHISSLDDGIKTANRCKAQWPLTRDKVLRSFPWHCLKERKRLTPMSSDPPFGFTHQYRLPADLLRLLNIENIAVDQPFELESGKILVDESDHLDLRYIRRSNNPDEYDALLFDLLATTLAYDIGESLTQSNTKMTRIKEDLKVLLPEARMVSSIEDPHFHFESDDWEVARLG